MSISNKLIAISGAVLLSLNPGLAEKVDAHEPKSKKLAITVPETKPELKTLQQLGVPSIENIRPYKKFPDRVGKMLASTEYVELNGDIYLRTIANGRVYIIFACRASPSYVSYYYSSEGNGLFQDLSPEEVKCNPAEYKP